jgi:hypothetical protein
MEKSITVPIYKARARTHAYTHIILDGSLSGVVFHRDQGWDLYF